MTSDSEKSTTISYSSELSYLRLAVQEQEEAYDLICEEIENFSPPTRDELIERLLIQYRSAPNPDSLQEFIENQADAYLNRPDIQLGIAFANRYAVRTTLSVLVTHAYCEGLINAILAIGLNHFGKSELFSALEMCSLTEKWEICPIAFSPKYKLDKSSAIFNDLKKLSKIRNATTHQKIELRDHSGSVTIKGKFSRLSLDKKTRTEIHRFFKIPRKLVENLNETIDDKFLKFKISNLLR